MAWFFNFNHHRMLVKKIDCILAEIKEVQLNQDALWRFFQHRLDRVERSLNIIINEEKQEMSAIDDLKAELQGVADTADAIKDGIQKLEDAVASGNQAAVDAAMADLKTSADNAKAHVDAANAALPAAVPPTA